MECVGGANDGNSCLGGGVCVGGAQDGAACRDDSFCARTEPRTCVGGGSAKKDACDTDAECDGGTCTSAAAPAGIDGTCEPRTVCVGGETPGLNCLADGECSGGTCEHPDCGASSVCSTQLDGLQLVGCGGAQDDRPIVEANQVSGQIGGNGRGISAFDTSDLRFQSIATNHWDSDGIFSSRCDDVVYRDIKGDGLVFGGDPLDPEDRTSSYIVFPVDSVGVTVEGSNVSYVDDAAVYVGRSSTVLTQFNRVTESVTGIEIENTSYAIVQGNHAEANSGGILSFMVSGPPRQDHGNHLIRNNVMAANNQVNTGEGTVGVVPPGSGMVIVADHNTDIEWNVILDNDTSGMLLLDQIFLVALEETFPLSPVFAVRTLDNTRVRNNVFSGNGGDPDPVIDEAGVPAAELHYFNANATAANLAGQDNNCFSNNGGASKVPTGFPGAFTLFPNGFIACP